VTDPAWATGAFLYALGGIEGWAEMDPWEAAHRTQGNRYASDYQRWWEDGDAGDLLSRFLDMSECATLPVDPPYYMTSGWGPRDTGIPGASRWHPAWDFDPGACGQPVYAMRPGEVVMVGGGAANNLGIVDPDSGAQLQYLHMPPGGELVGLGDQVDAGEQIGVIGDYGVGGCHLDLRIYAPRVLGESRITDDLTHTEDLTDEAQSGYVHPNEYAGLFGLDLCAPENCTNLVE
jgi:murein DD-endopeptidase MepM/ murein hydrolase activator NlpD